MALNKLLTADKEQLAFLSSLCSWQMIQNLAPSTIVWRQCDIRIQRIGTGSFGLFVMITRWVCQGGIGKFYNCPLKYCFFFLFNNEFHLGTHAESNSRNLSPNTLTNSQLKIHSGWVNIWQNIIIELDSYVREHHSKGFKWKKDS